MAKSIVERRVYSVSEFCQAHGICRATFYNLKRNGEAPRTMLVGGRVMISFEAATIWRAEREAAAMRAA